MGDGVNIRYALAGALLLISAASAAEGVPFFEQRDKQQHMLYSAVGANALLAMGATPKQAFWTMLAIGAIKEATDDNTAKEHGMDMVANAIGASTVFVWSIKF